jgi:hypothetical protein
VRLCSPLPRCPTVVSGVLVLVGIGLMIDGLCRTVEELRRLSLAVARLHGDELAGWVYGGAGMRWISTHSPVGTSTAPFASAR